jgi:hypothetical protein
MPIGPKPLQSWTKAHVFQRPPRGIIELLRRVPSGRLPSDGQISLLAADHVLLDFRVLLQSSGIAYTEARARSRLSQPLWTS